jgi:hypothetical protein
VTDRLASRLRSSGEHGEEKERSQDEGAKWTALDAVHVEILLGIVGNE